MALRMPFALGIRKGFEFSDAYFRVDEVTVNFREKFARYKVFGFADETSADDGSSPLVVLEFGIGAEEFDLYFAKSSNWVQGCYVHAKQSPTLKTIGVPPVAEEKQLADGTKSFRMKAQPNVGPFDAAEDV